MVPGEMAATDVVRPAELVLLLLLAAIWGASYLFIKVAVLEMPVALAQKLGVKSGDWVRVSSARGELEVKALVTPRMKALKIGDREVTVVWMPYNWGYQGLSTGPSVNHITIDASDPGAGTQETKACLVNVVRAGRPAARRSGSPRGRT